MIATKKPIIEGNVVIADLSTKVIQAIQYLILHKMYLIPYKYVGYFKRKKDIAAISIFH